MVNFIIKILELNKEIVQSLKESVIDRHSFYSVWAHDNLGILVLIYSLAIMIFATIGGLVILPIGIIMITINALYNISKSILKSTYFYRKLIRNRLKEYEDLLNKKDTYFLCDKNNVKTWTYIAIDPSVEDFMSRFFIHLNGTYDTYEMNTNKFICRRHRRRSIGDVYLICKSYYPDIDLNQVIKCLIRLIDEEKINVSKCSEIKKYVFVRNDGYTNNYMSKDLEFIKGTNFEQLIAYYERNGGLS